MRMLNKRHTQMLNIHENLCIFICVCCLFIIPFNTVCVREKWTVVGLNVERSVERRSWAQGMFHFSVRVRTYERAFALRNWLSEIIATLRVLAATHNKTHKEKKWNPNNVRHNIFSIQHTNNKNKTRSMYCIGYVYLFMLLSWNFNAKSQF